MIEFDKKEYLKTLKIVEESNLKTICLEANCPNRYECFSRKTATVLILGDTCTRNCKYCNVKKGRPQTIPDESEKIIELIQKLNLEYLVITQVTRDDLDDGGADHICKIVKIILNKFPKIKIELLISDLNGNWDAFEKINSLDVDVINHNIEVVERLFPSLRPEGNYKRSLELLKKINSKTTKKSGIMVGLGETREELIKTFGDLRKVNVQVLTIGQYLKPNQNSVDVEKVYSDIEFEELKKIALEMGFEKVESGKLVRSSYNAGDLNKIRLIPIIEDNGAMQMAIDEAITIARSQNKVPDTLRFYIFSPPTITIGYQQKIEVFKKRNFPIIRRLSGGTSVLHKDDLTYSLVLKEDNLPNSVVDAYKYLSLGLINGFNLLGIKASHSNKTKNNYLDACYLNSNPYDVVVNEKKISGNAQTRINGVVLQHGTIIITNNLSELFEQLEIKGDDKNITSIEECLGYIPEISEIEEKMIIGFEELFKEKNIVIENGVLTDYEKELAKKLFEQKYSSSDWNSLKWVVNPLIFLRK